MHSKKTTFYINAALLTIAALLALSALLPTRYSFIHYALAAIGNITGEGNVNRIARFAIGAPLDPTNQIGNSIIYDTGTRVGIGTITPGKLLTINGVTAVIGGGASTNYQTGDALSLGVDTVSHVGWIQQGGGVGYLLLNPQGGNVGIGTASPNAHLQIVGSNGNSADPTSIQLRLTNHGGEMFLGNTYTNGPFTQYTSQGVGHPFIGFLSNKNLYIGVWSGNTVMSVLNTGNVGIGTVNPTSPLEIVQGNNYKGLESTRGAENWNLGISTGPDGIGLYNENTGTYGWYVTSSGNVGIGTVTPGARLHVSPSCSGSSCFPFRVSSLNNANLIDVRADGPVGIGGAANGNYMLKVYGTIKADQKLILNPVSGDPAGLENGAMWMVQ